MKKNKENDKPKVSDTVIACFDWGNEDYPILVVGRRNDKHDVDIINSFSGDEARELYKKLTERRFG